MVTMSCYHIKKFKGGSFDPPLCVAFSDDDDYGRVYYHQS